MNLGIRPLGRIDNFRRTLIQDRVVVRFHPNTNDFLSRGHVNSPPTGLENPNFKDTAHKHELQSNHHQAVANRRF